MNKKITPYIYIVFFTLSFHGIFAQHFHLKLTSKDKNEKKILNQIDYLKIHKNYPSISSEVNSVSEKLKKIGFFTNQYQIKQNDSIYTAIFKLGVKTKFAVIDTKNANIEIEAIENDTIQIPIEELEPFLLKLKSNLEKEGKVFSEIKLINHHIKNSKLYTQLIIKKNKQRTIDKIIVKGYDKFPKSFLKNHFKELLNKPFNNQQLKFASDLSRSLSFVEEISEPETLFLKDSTILYLSLKKKETSSFDGIINFSNDENTNKLIFNGKIDLELNNILHGGEEISFLWNQVSNENSELNIQTTIPYIFNSRISLSSSLNIFRQDSTFINTDFNNRLSYQLNPKIKLNLNYKSLQSNDQNTNIDSIQNFKKSQIGFGISYKKISSQNLFTAKTQLSFNYNTGKRETDNSDIRQQDFEFKAEHNILINSKSYINIKNSTRYLDSKNLFYNELYRIGGINTIRGFIEQSIYTNKYSIFNLEYRFKTSDKSFLYTITDIGFHNTFNKNKIDNSQGYGVGYQLSIKNNYLNIGLATGINSQNNFTLNNSQVILKWKSVF